jgi:pyruvate/2-oxoglutarate dehydrogenase complex dihydrolipoamide acyltransferase (E2) component
MKAKTAAMLLMGLLFGCAQTPPTNTTAQPAPGAPAAVAQAGSPAPAATPPASATPAAKPAPAPAQAAKPAAADHVVKILRSTCQDLLRLSPQDRDAASMFYIGYQASHFRATSINVGLIPSTEDQALTYCAEDPNRTVAQVFAQAYLRSH